MVSQKPPRPVWFRNLADVWHSVNAPRCWFGILDVVVGVDSTTNPPILYRDMIYWWGDDSDVLP